MEAMALPDQSSLRRTRPLTAAAQHRALIASAPMVTTGITPKFTPITPKVTPVTAKVTPKVTLSMPCAKGTALAALLTPAKTRHTVHTVQNSR